MKYPLPRRLRGFIAYHLWIRLPERVALHTWLGRRLLPWVGDHAYADE